MRFTARQEDILREIQTGDENKVIAHRLGITSGTLKVYIARLSRLLGINNRTHLAIYAISRAAAARYE